MKTWIKAILCIALSLMCVFTCVGYAAVSDSLQIKATAKIDIPYGLFITNVITKGMSNIDTNSVSFLPHSTTIDSTINKKNNVAGTVTYNVTVLNNTKLTYTYRDIYYQKPQY